ncbi:amidohydrolase [Colletotrichum tofieldiae]|uniref:Amidohydrolase n=1 Tax=Colletotrichum tofieldiae TaxID=708197 RepID=A0A166W2N2_9PEZI|nr:amidohydrolase [Colletotrichum tofieldiae]GKT94465.1 amidohydrolase [Colletotrichum tofieldiae]
MTKIILQNVRVFDGEVLLKANNVIMAHSAGNIMNPFNDDGSVVEVADVVVDGHGCTLLPGLIDVDVNIKGASSAIGEFATCGVTTVIDLSSSTQQCQAMRIYTSCRTKLPAVLFAGTEATPSHHTRPYDDNPNEIILRTPEDAVTFAAASASGPDHTDFVKVVVDSFSLDDTLLKVIVDSVHAHKMLAIARTAGNASYDRALRAGFDVFVHAPLDSPLGPELAREMAVQGKVFVPTLGTMLNFAAHAPPLSSPLEIISDGNMRASPPEDMSAEGLKGAGSNSKPGSVKVYDYSNAVASVRVLYEAGVTICAGTTANLMPDIKIPFGESLHRELELLVEAGMSRLDVLRSATCVAAKAFRLLDRGIVQSGLRADLLLVKGNPLEDITATRKVERVWIRGEEISLERVFSTTLDTDVPI